MFENKGNDVLKQTRAHWRRKMVRPLRFLFSSVYIIYHNLSMLLTPDQCLRTDKGTLEKKDGPAIKILSQIVFLICP